MTHPPKEILSTAKTALETHRAAIIEEERKFSDATLAARMKIGLHCLKAHMVFAQPDPVKTGIGRHKRTSVSTMDTVKVESFETWLERECPWLKRPTAYRYMTALKGLGLGELSTEEDVDDAVRQNLRIGPVTVKSLCDAATEQIAAPAPVPPSLMQSEFDFICGHLRDFRLQSEALHAVKDQLQQNPQLMKVATARAYNILYDLTGCHWAPSDEAPELATVDPDSLTL